MYLHDLLSHCTNTSLTNNIYCLMKTNLYFRLIISLFLLIPLLSEVSAQGGDGEYTTRQIVVDDSLREYIVYTPPGYNSDYSVPLVILFHGFDAPVLTQIDVSQLYLVADTANFIAVYPQGLVVEDLIFGGSAPGWNIPGNYSAYQDDVYFIDMVIDDIIASEDYSIDTNRIHATGWSNGGEMAYYVACKLSNRIASVASVSGPMSLYMINEACMPSRAVSYMHVQGTVDPFAPVEGNETVSHLEGSCEYWAKQGFCDTIPEITYLPDINTEDSSTVTHKAYNNCDQGIEVVLYRVENGGHCWPGGWLPEEWAAWLGHINMDFHASVDAWEFFKRNPHPNIFVGIHPSSVSNSLNVFPNPFSNSVHIEYQLESASLVTIRFFDQFGKLVDVIERHQSADPQQVFWAPDLPSGIYYLTLQAGEQVVSGKVVKM